MSVDDIVFKAGHRVVFDRDDEGNDISHAIHKKSGEILPFYIKNKVWKFDMEVEPYQKPQPKAKAKASAGTKPAEKPVTISRIESTTAVKTVKGGTPACGSSDDPFQGQGSRL